ncbi:MAG: pyridoxal-dependent decarboxylase [Acidobacteriota bacterium]
MAFPRSDDAARRAEDAAALDLGPEARRALLDAMHEMVETYLAGLDVDSPSFVEAGPDEGALAVPEEALPLDRVTALLEREVLRPGGHAAAPGHLAYITGSGLFASAVADYVAAATNKFAGLEATGPGLARMERAVLRWAADLVGYPPGAGGYLASGGSLATFAAIVAARDAHRLGAADVPRAVIYTSSQAHHCVHKALHLAGLGEATLRPCDAPRDAGRTGSAGDGRLDPATVARAIADDRAAGRRPWLVVATAGTTDTGVVDPLEALADVAVDTGCWLHVDAAYGGAFLLTEHGRRVLRGIERADSLILDPHKGLFVPWGLGIVLTRDARALAAAHAGSGAYLQDAEEPDDVSGSLGGADSAASFSPADLSPELTKPFRALRLWLPLALAGVAPFRDALDEKLALARHAYDRLGAAGFTMGPVPDLSIVTFRWIPTGLRDGADDAAIEAANRRIHEALRHDGRIFLSSTRVDGRFTLRLCVLGFRTRRPSVDLAVRLLTDAVRS